jgi:uncharacterized phage infection (PIP) family protein YhgE
MVAAPALAQSTTTSANRRGAAQAAAMDTIKGRAKQAIDMRLATLSNLSTLVGGAKHISSANRSALAQQLADEKSGLTALETKIQADSDMQTLINDARSIVSAYRVYLLVEPKVHEVLAADRMLAVVDAFDTVFGRVDNKVTADADKALLADAKALLADAKAKVADAQSKAQGVPGAVLGLQPAGYPGNRPALQSARDSLRTGRQDLVGARQDVAKLVHPA